MIPYASRLNDTSYLLHAAGNKEGANMRILMASL